MPPERKKAALACTECRARKRRCQFQGGPKCIICERLDIQCVMVSDGRKERPQSRKLSDLEHKLSYYKTMASTLRKSLDDAAAFLKTIEEDKFRPSLSPESPQSPYPEPPAKTEPLPRSPGSAPAEPRRFFQAKTFQNAKHVSVSVYGPTSIFDTESLPHRELLEEHRPASLSKNPRIIECIQLFFRWQYPDMHAFIFREAFLLDFFDPDSRGVYSSTELVYAICSVGASMAEDSEIRASAEQFYRMSRDLLMATIDAPSISSLQAYLLLGLYDIYNYRNNAGWMLTGDALRVGFGIGFHLRPESWLVGDTRNADDSKHISDITISVRSRIFWGCFMADRFVSLILGRPSVIKPDASTIHVSANMPAIQWIQPYTYPGIDSDEKAAYIDISNPLGSIISLAQISDNMMEQVFAGRKLKHDTAALTSKLALVESYNKQIMQWRAELPDHLRWDRALLEQKGHDTTKMFTRYYFYIILMCLNRPFVAIARNQESSSFNSSAICSDAIGDVHAAIYSFVKAHGPRRCSILIVYSCIISISILLMKTSGNFADDGQQAGFFFDFMAVLVHTSTTWKLSEKTFLKLRGTMKVEHGLDYEIELQKFLNSSYQRKDSILDLLYRSEDGPGFGEAESEIIGPEMSNETEFNGFGDSSAWSSLFPDFFSAESF